MDSDNNKLDKNSDIELNKKSDYLQKTVHLTGMYKNWFLDYASYVILERAVPHINDGLKPVQRRILYSMKELDDGRYSKVANIVGHTMKYHPHGDASIGDALVQIGQKDLLIDTQGNWGNILTGDRAAASRYIEARLSKFALDVVFNSKTCLWKLSYDGRNKEPITLPVKFPLLLAQGTEGIAVGLASKILPHNFNELIDASIDILKGKEINVFPDFSTGGMADFSKYNDGLRGDRVKIRAKIKQTDKKTLVITEIPFGKTTNNIIDSIISANDKGKIKIRKIEDNTSGNVEIVIHLPNGVSPDITIDALYAFTDCEISIAPNACIIQDDKPKFIGTKEILNISTSNTLSLLKKELEIKKYELQEALHFASLEKLFIEKEIYLDIRKCETWKSVINTIDKGLEPYKKQLYRNVTKDDIIRLTEIKIKRISKYDSFKADKSIEEIEINIEEVSNHLEHIIDYAISYFIHIKKKYGKGHERKTEIRNFDTIEASAVAVASQKLYVNRKQGFAGTSMKKDEYVCDCSDIDDIIIFCEDGTFIVTKVSDKIFIKENIIYINVFKKNDDRTIYNIIYHDGKKGYAMAKRFAVKGVTHDKKYILTKGTENSKVIYFSVNPNGEAEIVNVYLKPKPRLRKLSFNFDFSTLAIKGRSSIGNILTKNNVRKITLKDQGISTLNAIDIWYDDTIKRLNTDERGIFLGSFYEDDKILTITESGYYKLLNYDLSNHFEEDMIIIEKFNPDKILSAVYYDGKSNKYYAKRFKIDITDKKTKFITDNPESKLINIINDKIPGINIFFKQEKNSHEKSRKSTKIILSEFISVKSYKAKGKKLTDYPVKHIKLLEPLPYEEETKSDDNITDEQINNKNNLHKEDKKKDDLPETNKKHLNDSPPETDKKIQMTIDF
jgi:topoisomerase-4 subunit A